MDKKSFIPIAGIVLFGAIVWLAYFLGSKQRPVDTNLLMQEIKLSQDSLYRAMEHMQREDSITKTLILKDDRYKRYLKDIDKKLENNQKKYNEISTKIDKVDLNPNASVIDILNSWSRTVAVGRKQIHLSDPAPSFDDN